MLRSLKELFGYELRAEDGGIGNVDDFFFDDQAWILRYLVAKTGFWIFGQKVLISLQALRQPVWALHQFPVSLTREQVKSSPPVDLAKPVSRQYEEALVRHYHWPTYWGVPFALNPGYIPPYLFKEELEENEGGKENPHLRSIRALIGYQVQAKEGQIGQVIDFIVDDENWTLVYLVVQTDDLPRTDKQVLVAVVWMDEIRVASKVIHLDLTRASIQFSPTYDPGLPVNRQYEEILYDYYGRPKYWQVID